MGSRVDGTVIGLLLPVLYDIQITRYSELASSTIILYDHVTTLDQEVELIWKAPWTFGKLLFLMNRYYPLATVIYNNYTLFSNDLTDEFCVTWFRWQSWTALVGVMMAELILQVRLYALYFLDRGILLFMMASFVASTATAATIMGIVLSSVDAHANLIPGLPFCIPSNVKGYTYAFWIPISAFESLLCGMAIFRGFQAFHYQLSFFKSGRHLVSLLLRDSIVYYLIVFATYFTNLVMWSTNQLGLIEIPGGFTMAMSCVMGNRLILNVRLLKRETEANMEHQENLTFT